LRQAAEEDALLFDVAPMLGALVVSRTRVGVAGALFLIESSNMFIFEYLLRR
jgi:hypothetical protein